MTIRVKRSAARTSFRKDKMQFETASHVTPVKSNTTVGCSGSLGASTDATVSTAERLSFHIK